jgi:hypothetical protein
MDLVVSMQTPARIVGGSCWAGGSTSTTNGSVEPTEHAVEVSSKAKTSSTFIAISPGTLPVRSHVTCRRVTCGM